MLTTDISSFAINKQGYVLTEEDLVSLTSWLRKAMTMGKAHDNRHADCITLSSDKKIDLACLDQLSC